MLRAMSSFPRRSPRFAVSFTIVAVILSVAVLRTHAQAAAAPAVEEPQYVGQFAEVDSAGKLTPLEKQKMTSQSQTKNHFVKVTTATVNMVPNAASPVRVAPDTHFVVRVQGDFSNIDPSTVISLKKFTVDKDTRTIPVAAAKAGWFQGAKGSVAPEESIQVNFKKYGTTSLEVDPAQPLAPGEYALIANNGVFGVYCFGVDAK